MGKAKKDWILYCRSFLITIGIGLLLFSTWWSINLYNTPPDAAFNYVMLAVFILFSVILFYVGLFASDKKAKSWANSVTADVVAISIMVLAYPVYKFLKLTKWFEK